ncbi:MAG: uracil-DNA glycosylase [Muribaculaceae bacterium]|nr:uracil-DNA glycosylase [Muribaculaceae bacterium]
MDVKIHPSWKGVLATEFNSEYFVWLAEYVRKEYSDPNVRVYPPASKILEAYNATPYDEVKVVIIGQDPYHGPGQANGLAFSVNPGIAFPPSLLNIFTEIKNETGAPIPENGDLTRWARQGVLLLNSSLTVREHQPRSHSSIGWEKLTSATIKLLSEGREGLVFMLWGSDAIKKAELIDKTKHLVLTSPHPSPLSAYRGFFGNGHFNAANTYLQSQGKQPIVW